MNRAERAVRNAAIVEAVRGGAPISKVAREHGLTSQAVYGIVRKASEPPQVTTRALRNAVIAQLHSDGVATGRIAQALRISENAVRYTLSKRGIEPYSTVTPAADSGPRVDRIFTLLGSEADIDSVTGALLPLVIFHVVAGQAGGFEPVQEYSARTNRIDRIVELHRAGHTIEEIRDVTGCSEHVVRSSLTARGIELPPRPPRARGIPAKTERNEAIVEMARAGATFTEIAAQFGVTRERARQIVSRDSASNAQDFAEARTARKQAERIAQAHALILSEPDMPPSQIAKAAGLRTREVRALLTPLEEARRQRSAVHKIKRYGDDEVASWLQHVAAMLPPGTPLAGPYYDKHRPDGAVSQVRLIQIYGTWSTVCTMAGVIAPKAARKDYSKKWTPEQMREHVQRFLAQAIANGTSQSHDAYELWSRTDPDAPSGATVRNTIGYWSAVRLEALAALEQQSSDRQTDYSADGGNAAGYRNDDNSLAG